MYIELVCVCVDKERVLSVWSGRSCAFMFGFFALMWSSGLGES